MQIGSGSCLKLIPCPQDPKHTRLPGAARSPLPSCQPLTPPRTRVLANLDIGAVHGADDEAAVESKLHVAGAAGLSAGSGDVLAALSAAGGLRVRPGSACMGVLTNAVHGHISGKDIQHLLLHLAHLHRT